MKQLFTLLLPFCMLLIGCEDDDIVQDPAYTPREESAFDCTNSESWQIDAADFQINEMTRFGDYFVFGGFDDLLVMDEDLENIVLEQEVGVREFLLYDNKLIICGEEGLHELTSDGMFTTLNDLVNCQDVIIGPEGELLVADAWTGTQSVAEFVGGEIVRYTDVSPETEMCIGIYDLALGSDNTLWVSTCSDRILKFNGRTFVTVYNAPVDPLLAGDPDDLFLLPYEDGVVLVAKNGTSFYQILKYTRSRWIELAHFSLLQSTTTSKRVFMNRPSLVDAFIKDDFLYVATTLAGCEGIQRFDISKDEVLTPDDYDAFEDPFYTSQCINGFTLEEDGDVYVIANGNQLVEVDCP